MADGKTEKPTAKRRKDAREKGQISRSRDLSSALAWGGSLALLVFQAPNAAHQWRGLLQSTLDLAVEGPLTVGGPAMFWNLTAVLRWSIPLLITAWVMSVAGGLAQGGLTFATDALTPKVERFSPAGKLGQMFSLTGLSAILKSLLPFAVIVWIGFATIQDRWPIIVSAASMTPRSYVAFLAGAMYSICWKGGLVLLVWAGADYLLTWLKNENGLKMSRQEIRDESKETDGNPQIKGRIRRMQRQMRRRQMLRDTETASVVITNPTHFAVALRYETDMDAPLVVAKGRDLLAAEIKEVARWHGVTIMENPPLAQTLYKTVEVGRQIPAELYAAVAEILAFVFRAQAQARAASQTRKAASAEQTGQD
ncbi:MAG: EscU/YscU/HrcU family type III secretion system export apparatus switch protein [Terriglobales bacterium]